MILLIYQRTPFPSFLLSFEIESEIEEDIEEIPDDTGGASTDLGETDGKDETVEEDSKEVKTAPGSKVWHGTKCPSGLFYFHLIGTDNPLKSVVF